GLVKVTSASGRTQRLRAGLCKSVPIEVRPSKFPFPFRLQYHFVVAVWKAKQTESDRVKHWEIIADNLKKAGWSLGYVSAIDSNTRTVWIADAGVTTSQIAMVATGIADDTIN